MTYQERTQALLQLVDNDRAKRRNTIVDAARLQARTLVAQAYRGAREHLRAAWREERERHANRVGAAQAELQTQLRVASQERERALLARASAGLPDALERRWADPGTRNQWVRHAIGQALSVLAVGTWRVEHAPRLTDEERCALSAELGAKDIEASFCPVAAWRAGLRIVCGATAIDASLDGLLMDQDEIGARLLVLMEAAP